MVQTSFDTWDCLPSIGFIVLVGELGWFSCSGGLLFSEGYETDQDLKAASR